MPSSCHGWHYDINIWSKRRDLTLPLVEQWLAGDRNHNQKRALDLLVKPGGGDEGCVGLSSPSSYGQDASPTSILPCLDCVPLVTVRPALPLEVIRDVKRARECAGRVPHRSIPLDGFLVLEAGGCLRRCEPPHFRS